MGDITRLGLNAQFIDTKQRSQPVVKATLEEAIKFAKQDEGEEAIIQTGEQEFTVVDLKDKTGAEALFDPAATDAKFGGAIVMRKNNRAEVVAPLGSGGEEAKLKSALRLSDVILNNSVTGFKSAADQRAETGQAYQANLAHVLNQLETLDQPGDSKSLTAKRDALKGELEGLQAAQPPDQAAIDAKSQQLGKLQGQLDELNSARVALRSKLLIASPSQQTVPGTNLTVGSLRNKPEAVEAGLQQRIGELTDKLATNLSPEARSSVEKQIKSLQDQIKTAKVETVGNLQAQVHTDMRVGALGTINKAIVDQQKAVDANAAKVKDLEAKLKSNPTQFAAIQGQLKSAQDELESSRAGLVKTLKEQTAVFREHSAKVGAGGKASDEAAQVLDAQIAKLEAVKGKPAAEIQATVEAVRKEFQEGALVDKVEAAAKQWVGISPKEGTLIKDIVRNNDGYLASYKAAKGNQERLDKLSKEAEVASKFSYSSPTRFKDMMDDANHYIDAQNWKPGDAGVNGVEANSHFNETYHQLDQKMFEVLGQPSWLTFGKFASREAGTQIRNLETALSALHTFTTTDGSGSNDLAATGGLLKMFADDPKGLATQGILLSMQKAGIKVEKGASPENIVKALTASGPAVIADVLAAVDKLHKNLVQGNTEIFRNAAPPFDTFMKNPPATRMAEVEKLLKSHPMYGKDPQALRMATDAFKKYDEIARMNVELKMPSTSPERKAELQTKMKQLAEEANLSFVTVEQMFAQGIYNTMIEETGVMTGNMQMHDTTGAHDLLAGKGPGQGNWAQFADRMGFDKVAPNTPGAMELDVLQTDGTKKKEWYKPNHQPGTISQYFRDGLDPGTAKKMTGGMISNPRPYYNAEQQGTEMRQLIEKFDTSTAKGKADMNKALADFYTKHIKGSNTADNSVVALIDELERHGKLGDLTDNVRTMFFKELDDGYTTDNEYATMGKLATGASSTGRADMKAYLDSQWWFTGEQRKIYHAL